MSLFTEGQNRITPDFLENQIVSVEYTEIVPKKLTHCTITVANNFTFTGESACVDPANYKQEIGESVAYDNAFDKMWPAYGFLLAQHLYENA